MTEQSPAWDEKKARTEHEFDKEKHNREREKERHYWKFEWVALGIVALATVVCAIALLRPGGSAGWAQNTFSGIVGAAIAFTIKRNGGSAQKPPPAG